MVRRTGSGKAPVQIEVPSQENQNTSDSIKPIQEGVSKKIFREDSGYGSEEEGKSIRDYKVDAVDLKEKASTFLSSEESIASGDEATDQAEAHRLRLDSIGTEIANNAIMAAVKELQNEKTDAAMELADTVDSVDPVTSAADPVDPVTPVADISSEKRELTAASPRMPDKSQRFIRVYDKDVVRNMTSQLLQRVEQFISGYSLCSQLGTLNIKQAINEFDKNGLRAAGGLFEKLDDFALLLANQKEKELELNAHKKSDKAQLEREYNTLALSFDLLKDVVKDIHYDNLTRECKHKLRDAFSRFENPSEESSLRARAQVGVDVNIAKLDAGVEVSTQLVGCDDTKIRLFKNKKLTHRFTAGVNLAKGYISGTVGEIKGEVFKNIDEFVDYYGDSFLLALHGKKQPSMSVWRDTRQIKEGIALKKRIIQNVSRLEQQLKKLKLDIVQEGVLKYGSSAKPVPLMIKRAVTESQLGVRFAKSFGLDRVDTKWENTFIQKAPILTQLKKHPEWCKDYDNSYFNMAIVRDKDNYLDRLGFFYSESLGRGFAEGGITSYKGGKIIPLLGNRFEVLKGVVANQRKNSGERLQGGIIVEELSVMQTEVLQLLEQNYQEYKVFCELVNKAKTAKNKKLHPTAIQLMELRGAKKELEMLQRFMITHARLSHIYRQAGQLLKQDRATDIHFERLEFIEQDLSVPDIPLSQGEMEKYLMLNQELHGSITFNDIIARVMLGPFEGLADVRHIKNRNEPNPDSDGDYLFVVFRGSLVGNVSLAETSFGEALTKLMGNLPSVASEMPIMIEATSDVESVLQGVKHLKMELFFVKGEDGSYHEQYKRLLFGEEFSVKGGGKVPLTGVLSLSGQVAADHYAYHFLTEELGTDTITYVQTRYNGWKIGNKPGKWDEFLEDSKNRERLAKIMVNMATGGANAGNEFRTMKSDIKAHYQTVCNSGKSLEADKKKARAILDKLDSGEWDESFSNLEKAYRTYHNTVTLPAKSELRKAMASAAKRALTKNYETLVEETSLSDREKFALESVVKIPEFTVAMRAFQDVLEACHAPYLKEAKSRFQDVNPNQPVLYKKS